MARWVGTRRVLASVALALGLSRPVPALPPADGVATALPPVSKRKKRRSAQQPVTVTRWLQSDVEAARQQAGQGRLSRMGRLWRALRGDGMLQGLLGTRTNGLVRLPRTFLGDDDARAILAGTDGQPGLFDAGCPDSEIALIDADGIVCGVGIGELLDVPGRDHPVLCRLDPEFLSYRWWEDAWYYQTVNGEERVTPGDGRWVLHTPGGRQDPWNGALLWSLARSFVSKEHAILYRENWSAKLAHPARVAYAPQGSSEPQKEAWFRKVLAWGVNTVFGLTPGYEVKILESNGRGYEAFTQTIGDANQEFMVSIAGQVVTTTGGTGFANADVHATIRSDLIQGDGQTLAQTISEQVLPYLLEGRVANTRAWVHWDTRKPTSRNDEATALSAAAGAITDLVQAMTSHGLEIDVRELATRFGVPLVPAKVEPAPPPQLEGAANDEAASEIAPIDAYEADEPLEDDAAARLAARMTEVGAEACWHGRTNRCPLCRIEVEADCDVDPQTREIVWTKRWVPLGQSRAA